MQATLHTGGRWRSLKIQARVIGALTMREILTRYGRHNIGFMWIFVEPMMFTGGVVTLWTLLGTHHTQLPLIPFTITGYSSVLLWRNAISRCGNAVEPNRSLLHHRNVRILDLFAARLILEVAGASISLLTLSGFMIAMGAMQIPDDILKMIIAWGLLAWFAMSMGLIIGSLSVRSEIADRIWHVFSYLFLPLSGSFFMVDWLPKRVQGLAQLVPTVDGTELLREGYFGVAVHAHYDLAYFMILNTLLVAVGLCAVRGLPATVEGE